jgi:general stress protein YciG
MNDKRRGFASMDPAKQREIARKGGKAAHAKGTAHRFTPEEARAAGTKGGMKVAEDREHMAEIGRKGGERRHSVTITEIEESYNEALIDKV